MAHSSGTTESVVAEFWNESARQLTFVNFPISIMIRSRLAAAGFISTGNGEEVVCIWCRLQCRFWERIDPMEYHKAMSSTVCPFFTDPNQNIPVNVSVKVEPDDPPPYIQNVNLPTEESPVGAQAMEPLSEHRLRNQDNLSRASHRMVLSQMDTHVVERVLELGYDINVVREVIINRVRNVGTEFLTCAELVTAILTASRSERPAIPDPILPTVTHYPTGNVSGMEHGYTRSPPVGNPGDLEEPAYPEMRLMAMDLKAKLLCKICFSQMWPSPSYLAVI